MGNTLRYGASQKCVECTKVPAEVRRRKAIEATRRWQKAHPERAKETQRRFSKKHRARITARRVADRIANPDKYADKELRKTHGISLEQFRAVSESQGNVCKICGGTPKTKRLHVDHCHTTNKIRGLLCERCNMALGLFDDDVERIHRAAEYVAKSDTGLTAMPTGSAA